MNDYLTQSMLSTEGVKSLVNSAKAFNDEIGNYVAHFQDQRQQADIDYQVRLNNGWVTIKLDDAMDQQTYLMGTSKGLVEPISQVKIEQIAMSFREG